MTIFTGSSFSDADLHRIRNLTNYERAGLAIDLIGKARFVLEMNGLDSAEQVDVVIDALRACTVLRADPDDPTNSYMEAHAKST